MTYMQRHQAPAALPEASGRSEPALAEEPKDACSKSHGSLSLILLACVLSAAVAACGGSSTTSGSGSASTPKASPASASPAASSPAAPAGSTGTQAKVAANWTAFFDPKKPLAKRVSLLQDGSQFAAIIAAQAGAGLPSQASVKVTKVILLSATKAKVTYSILLNGQPVLPGQSGTAVLQGGTWKVGVASFCGLLALENTGSGKPLPAAC